MPANSFGKLFRVSTFGESHGPAIGSLIDGCPAGVEIQQSDIDAWMQRRRPGHHAWSSARKEEDRVEILSGVHQGLTLGTPVALLIRNQDARSTDYEKLPDRVGHADDCWREKFGHQDRRGGGRSSGRETACRVAAAAFAQKLCLALSPEIKIHAFVRQVSDLELSSEELLGAEKMSPEKVDTYFARFCSSSKESRLRELLDQARAEGRSYGGQARCLIRSAPSALGEPVFHKLKACLAAAMMGIGATSAFELGEGVEASKAEGSEWHGKDSSSYGGIRGGISTGETIHFNLSFKPTSSVLDVAKKGRHDPCIVPRAVPVIEAMTWLVLADLLLWKRLNRVSTK